MNPNWCLLFAITAAWFARAQQQLAPPAASTPPPPRSPCPHAIRINTNTQFRGTLHFICLQATNANPRLDVIQYYNRQLILSRVVDELGAHQLANFVDDEGTLRILVTVPNRTNGTSMYSVDSSGTFIEERHSINTQYVTAMAVWRLQLNWEWQLAIANKPSYESYTDNNNGTFFTRMPIPEPKPIISIHSWRPSYFDTYQHIYLPHDGHINKLEPMHIDDLEFLIVAMESYKHDIYLPGRNRSAPTTTNSMIYKLDFGDGTLNWVHYQYLNTELALDASSFAITHKESLQKDYYIAILGQLQPTDTGHQARMIYRPNQTDVANEYGLIIYKYFGDQFMNVHAIGVPGATKLDTISYGIGDSYVIIALLNGWSNHISLFLFDGLILKPMQSPSGPSQPSASPALARKRRVMDTGTLHLFMVPPVASNETSDASLKRTLAGDAQSMLTMPALAFSSSDSILHSGQLDSEKNSSQESFYQIPLKELIDTDVEQAAMMNQDESHAKRNLDAGQSLLAWCKASINTILMDNFEASSKQLLELPRVDQALPIELNGDLTIEGDLHISNLLYANRVEEVRGIHQTVVVESVQTNFSQTFEEIEQAHLAIDSVKRRVDQILVDDGSVQEIYNPLHFERLVIECMSPINMDPRLQLVSLVSGACLNVGDIRTVFLNSHDISDIQRQALLSGRSMTVARDVRFEHLILHGSVQIMDTLNGIPINEIVFGRGQSTGPIMGHKNFKSGLYSGANLLVNSWNGLPIDRHSVLTSSGEQRIDANIGFRQVIIDSANEQQSHNVSSRIESLNGLHLDTHLSQIALASTDNNFEVPLHFDELILNGPVYFPANSRLSSFDIENLWLNTMFKQSHQNVSAPMEFIGDVHVSYGGDIVVSGPINGVLLGRDNVMMRNRRYDLPNPIIFDGDLTVGQLQVDKALNGIQVVINNETRRYELSILYDGGTQLITGDKIFNQVHLGGSSYISGLINGHLNLTQLYHLANNEGKPYRFSSVHLIGQNIRIADGVDIHVGSMINGVPANDLCSLALHAAQSRDNQYDRLKFDQTITFKSLQCASVNGFNNLTNVFLTRYGNQHVAGTLKLVNGVIFNTTVNIGATLNELSVAPLSAAISQTINESRTGHKDVYGDLFIDDLITDRINDLYLSNVFIAKSDTPQIVRAPMTFDHLDIENVLIVDQNLVTNSFNGLNVTEIFTNTLQYDTPQVIYNHVKLQTFHLLPGSNLVTKSLNGFDLQRLYSDAVLIDAPQQILAPKHFRAPVEFTDRVLLRYGIDGLSEDELKFNLLLQGDELIDDDLEFHNEVTIMKELEIQSGVINDIDVNSFVNSMLYENRPGKAGLRITGNSSVRFKDVKVNNLVVTGTIQGLDVSKDALLRSDNVNGSYDAKLIEQQIAINNQRMLNHLHNSGTPFHVATNYHGQSFVGPCFVHSCPRTTPYIMSPTPPRPLALVSKPNPSAWPISVALPASTPRPVPYTPSPVIWTTPPKATPLVQPPLILPRPMNLINNSEIKATWRPDWNIITTPYPLINTTTARPNPLDEFELVDPKYLEHQEMLQAQAIRDLSNRVNRFLSISFYYEIVQKHPLLGPLLHAASNPILNEKGSALLLLKATSKQGEPCLRRGQTIAVMAQQRQRPSISSFTLDSRIQETSNPSLVQSLVVGENHYLFILDSYPEGSIETVSQVLIYLWDYRSGMYELKQRIVVDGFPTAMKAFVVNRVGCIALANHRLIHGNHSGAPILYCQQTPTTDFSQKIILPMHNVFDLDIVLLPSSTQVVIAALSQQDTEQIGDLIVNTFDIVSRSLKSIAIRRTVRPLKLHFIKQSQSARSIRLVVSEAITSNHDAQAITRIFTLNYAPTYINLGQLHETQIIRDNQFYDIQSVHMDNMHQMLFLQSAHSVSIYAPIVASNNPDCEPQFTLIQRLPTKGANRFLVFNNDVGDSRMSKAGPYGHFLVLSRDDCEHQQYSTLILRAKFE